MSKILNVRLTDELSSRLDFLAEKTKRPKSVITDLIPVQLQRDKREPKAPVH
jgi:predicted transcriptional regulator